MVHLLLNRGALGADIDAAGDNAWVAPIHCAVERGTTEILNLLLDRGARVDSLTGRGWQALHVAVAQCAGDVHNVLEEIGVLLDRGAEVAAVTPQGQQPLHVAYVLSTGARGCIR